MRTDARRRDREQLDANGLWEQGLLDLLPELVEIEEPLGHEKCRDDLLERRAFLFGHVEGDARAEAVHEPVRDLRSDDLVA